MTREKRQTAEGDSEQKYSNAVSRRLFLQRTAGSTGLAVGVSGLASGRVSSVKQDDSIPWLRVEGNQYKNPDGENVTLRGICTADPKLVNDTADSRGKNIEEVIDLATNAERGWYSNVIHLPAEPTYIGDAEESFPEPVAFSQEQLDSYVENHLDLAVQKCREEGIYCLIDYHRHRFRGFTDPALDEEIQMFWETIAPRYADQSHVLFELYNEPITPTDDEIDWPIGPEFKREVWMEWQDTAQPWVDLIRKHAPENPILIGSPLWSTYPQGAILHEEFEGQNLGYTVTLYPGHDPESVSEYDSWLDSVWEEVPLFVTEWGYQPETDDEHVKGTTEEFGQTMREWLSNRSIHWTAWCFDPFWYPIMFDQDSDTPSNWQLLGGSYQGEFVRDFISSYRS